MRWPIVCRASDMIVCSGLFISCMIGCAESDPQEEARRKRYGDKIGAWVMAQQYVENCLKSPGTAEFGWQLANECVTDLGGGIYRVRGWVDAENVFGGKVRNNFVLKLQCLGDDNWKLLEGPIFVQR